METHEQDGSHYFVNFVEKNRIVFEKIKLKPIGKKYSLKTSGGS